MKKRIYSMELELGMQLFPNISLSKKNPIQPNSTDDTLLLFKLIHDEITKKNSYLFNNTADMNKTFLRNGACVYIDGPRNLEYCLPECDNIATAVACDRAAMCILEDAAKEFQDFLQINNPKINVFIYKNNVAFQKSGSELTSYGTHENYSMSKKELDLTVQNSKNELDFIMRTAHKQFGTVQPDYFVDSYDKYIPFIYNSILLLPFFVTRPIICGAGSLVRSNSVIHYELSQRAKFINKEISDSTIGQKGIANIRDENLAADFYRIHVICGDANMSEFSNFLKLGTTGIILRMIEENYLISHHIVLDNPISALYNVSEDVNLNNKYRLWMHDRLDYLSAIDIQQYYLDLAKTFVVKYGNDAETDSVLTAWQFTLDCLRANKEKLFGKIDWITKKLLIDRKMETENLTFNNKSLKDINLLYHLLNHDKGVYYALEKKHPEWKIVSDDFVQKMRFNAPETRAVARQKATDLFNSNKLSIDGMGWDNICSSKHKYFMYLPDPFSPDLSNLTKCDMSDIK